MSLGERERTDHSAKHQDHLSTTTRSDELHNGRDTFKVIMHLYT